MQVHIWQCTPVLPTRTTFRSPDLPLLAAVGFLPLTSFLHRCLQLLLPGWPVAKRYLRRQFDQGHDVLSRRVYSNLVRTVRKISLTVHLFHVEDGGRTEATLMVHVLVLGHASPACQTFETAHAGGEDYSAESFVTSGEWRASCAVWCQSRISRGRQNHVGKRWWQPSVGCATVGRPEEQNMDKVRRCAHRNGIVAMGPLPPELF
jgi:hypothetical protein